MKSELEILRKNVAHINRGEGDDWDPIFAAFAEAYCMDVVNSLSKLHERARQVEAHGSPAWYTADQIAKHFDMSKNDFHSLIAGIKSAGFKLRIAEAYTVPDCAVITRYNFEDVAAGHYLLRAIKTVREASKLDDPFAIMAKFMKI